MPQLEKLFILPLVFTALISYALTPLVIRLAWRLGIVDDPQKNKHPKVTHSTPTPRGGGLAIFFALTISSLLFLPLDEHLRGILAGGVTLVILGLLDDRYNLNPYLRIAIQLLAASMPIAAGIGISFISNPLGGIVDLSHPQLNFSVFGGEYTIWLLSDLFALFWLVTLMNFLNMGAKGLPGQLSGVVAIAALTVGALSFRYSADITEWPVIILAAITGGAFLGFLPWHMYPQKIMPSFSGSNLGGYMLAILSILTTAKIGTLAMVLSVPLIDTVYQVVRRVGEGKSPVWGDRGHLHHRLLDKRGWSAHKVTYFYWLVTVVLGLIALNLNAENKLYTMIGITLLLGGGILWLSQHPKQ